MNGLMTVRYATPEKIELVTNGMEKLGLDVAILQEFESSPDINIKYLTGYPTFGFLLLGKNGETALYAYDILLAKKHAEVVELLSLVAIIITLTALNDSRNNKNLLALFEKFRLISCPFFSMYFQIKVIARFFSKFSTAKFQFFHIHQHS